VPYGKLLSEDLSEEIEKTTEKIIKDNTGLKTVFNLMAGLVYFGEFRKKYPCMETG
jgi:hypothetical protein